MNKKSISKSKNTQKLLKPTPIIGVVVFVVIIIAGMIFTKAGAIPNYFDIDFLCPGDRASEYRPSYLDTPMYKPAIYLYPERDQQTSVNLKFRGDLTVTYPNYGTGWNVVAHPGGKLTNLADGREYSYLFWEGVDKQASYDMASGFVVKGSDSVRFLQESLSKLGLTPVEYNEFIVFWLPKMQDNKYNLIHFATKSEYDDNAVLDINPKPDSILRIFMVIKKLNDPIVVQPQELKPFERSGFTVVEWGGGLVN